MTSREMPNNQNVSDIMQGVTLFPSGKENIGQEPIKGEKIFEKDKSSKLETGIRVVGGVFAFFATSSLLAEDPQTHEAVQTTLNGMIGTSGEILVATAGVVIASGKHGRKIITELAQSTTDKLKKEFVQGVAIAHRNGAKINKKMQSFTKAAIGKIKNKSIPFTVNRPKKDGAEGTEIAFRNLAAFIKGGRGEK